MNSIVILKKCESYEADELNKVFVDLISGFDKSKINDKKILIFFDEPTPEPRIVDLFIKFLKENGSNKITAGTSVFASSVPNELLEVFVRNDVEFIDFRYGSYERIDIPFRKVKTPERSLGFAVLSPVQYASEKAINKMDDSKIRTMKNVLLPFAFTECDYVVPIIKMKDSPIFKIGGFVNSMLYLIPTITRGEVFMNMLKGKDVEAILEIFNMVRSKTLFGVVDGIHASISESEDINKMNVLLFSEDLLSLDALLSVLIGFRSSEVATNELGNAFDFGNGILKRIDIFGDDFEKLRKGAIKNLRFTNALNRRRLNFPVIKNIQSQQISKVMDFCPTGAIVEENGIFSIDKNKCIKCNFCVEILSETFKLS
jgi:uncharacterized protein (DUF362 family)/Pyruvate/2-oxoacid:ferredoxin oxidoreductase delta subunit